ncbi:MAG: hypothetical protein DBP02_04150 [gamma proteobacterium symbiont of Ctena orbiculata]|nr:MAG: hypothetical protein DBP02_04150 [gamma proteobacterium symbiont of Ctena orbiculata]PUB90917.1 MAG: hypothetical protein DBP01_05115 [gamma proteobacterium symbiont of Ctena orbiculata]
MRQMRKRDSEFINLVIALPAEARPLINLLKLRRDQVNMEIPVYHGNGIQLAITGPGAVASARGVRYIQSIKPCPAAKWINLGICGHGSLAVGTPLLINRVIDQQSGKEWPLTIRHLITETTGALTCVPEPKSEYTDDMAFDMESSGFIQAVNDIGMIEYAKIFKIVSDNPANDSRRISAKFVHTLVQQQLGLIRSMIELTQ